jgi:hypothetical protein
LVQVPSALDEVVLRGLEREPELRFETARDMALAIESTMERASATQVGAWVEAFAADTLIKRKAMIARIEREIPQSGEVSVRRTIAPRTPVAPTSRRSSVLAWVLLIGLAALIVVYLRFQQLSSEPRPATIVLRAEPVREVAAAAPPLAEPPEPVVVPGAVPETKGAVEQKPSGDARSKRRSHLSQRAHAKRKVPCDPPYVIDAQGHKRFRVECL